MSFNVTLAQNASSLGEAAVAANLASDYWMFSGMLFAFFIIFVATMINRAETKAVVLTGLTLSSVIGSIMFIRGYIPLKVLSFVLALLMLMLLFYIFGEE